MASKRVVIVITNHSHDDSGDLYISANLSYDRDEVSSKKYIFKTLLCSGFAVLVCKAVFPLSWSLSSEPTHHHVYDVRALLFGSKKVLGLQNMIQ